MKKESTYKKALGGSSLSSLLKKLLFVIGVGVVVAAFGNFLLQLFQNQLNLTIAWKFVFQWHTELFLLGTLVLFLVYIWLTALFGHVAVSAGLLLVLSLGVGVATQQKMYTRGEPVYPTDLILVEQLPFLIQMIDLWLAMLVAIVALSSIVLIVHLLRKKNKRLSFKRKKKRWIVRAVTFVIASVLLVYVGKFNQEGNLLREAYNPYAYWIPYSQQMNYYNNGFVGGFLYNFRASAMEKPEGYSRSRIKELEEKYRGLAAETNESRQGEFQDVNLVYIMNESFSDPLQLEGISISEDPIPETRKLLDTYLSGRVLAQGYGGGTANSEYEALTGLSIEPLGVNVNTPFTQLEEQIGRFPSVADYLQDKGYATTAIHPYDTTMYKRSEVYDSLDFQTFIYDETMKYTSKKGGNPYISDEAAYKELMDKMRETKEKDFIHLVTMQNHMVYSDKYPDTEFVASGTGNAQEAVNYYQDLAYSDVALKEFLEQLDALPEKTIVVFWGDHLPSFYGEQVTETNSPLLLHQTPLLIYSNYEETEGTLGIISPIYFMNHVLQQADAEVTPYYALLQELENQLPAFEKGMYLEKGATTVKETREELSSETLEILHEYDLIQYDVTMGENYSRTFNFFGN